MSTQHIEEFTFVAAKQVHDVAMDNVVYYDCNWWTYFSHLDSSRIL
jgi:hypothetical protein